MKKPPINGPSAAAIAPGGRDQPVGARALGLAEVRRDQRHDRGHDQHRAQALQARPADHQHRQVRRQRRRQRPARVDDAADRERALAPEDLADLAAGDHQRRHHERVHRDRRLDPGHRRVEILRDGRDRRVHHGRVQRHHELARRQRQQDDPGSTRSAPVERSRAPCCRELSHGRELPRPRTPAIGKTRGRARSAPQPWHADPSPLGSAKRRPTSRSERRHSARTAATRSSTV